MALRNIPNLCPCPAVRNSVPCEGLREAAPFTITQRDRGCSELQARNKGGLSSGWEHRKYTISKWIKISGSCKNTATFWRSAGSQGSCRTWLSRQGNVWLPVPVQSCCSVMVSFGVTFKLLALTGRSLLYSKGCWAVFLPQKHNWFYHHQGNGFYWPFWPKTRVKVDAIWPSPWLVPHGRWSNGCSSAVPQSHCQDCIATPRCDAADALGCLAMLVQSPELLAVLCFVQRKTKPFTQPRKRSLPRLAANMLQSSSATLIPALALVWANHTQTHWFSLIFLFHPKLQASCFHFWSLYRPTALFCG